MICVHVTRRQYNGEHVPCVINADHIILMVPCAVEQSVLNIAGSITHSFCDGVRIYFSNGEDEIFVTHIDQVLAQIPETPQ